MKKQKSHEGQQTERLTPASGMPHAPIQVGADWLEGRFAEKALGVLVGKKLNTTQQCALLAKVSSLLRYVSKSVANGLREVILPLCSSLTRHNWSAVSTAGLPNTWTYRSASSPRLQRWLKHWST